MVLHGCSSVQAGPVVPGQSGIFVDILVYRQFWPWVGE